MLLAVSDLESAVVDVGALSLRVEQESVTTRSCPGCGERLHACAVEIDREVIDHEILACARDGLWLAGGVLEAVFLELASKHRGGRGGSRFYGGIGDSLTRKWWDKARPMVHTPFASALAGHLPCPVCTASLELRGRVWACDEHGVLVEHLAIAEMMTEMTREPWERPASTGSPGKRACPACAVAMVRDVVEGVSIDCCVAHGIWFDPGELEATLAHAVEHPRPWFRRLFG